MKKTLTLVLLFSSALIFGQTISNKANKHLILKYAGTYRFGKDIVKGRIGTIFIYPETDTTILFYIELNRGAPSYNMGSLYGRVKIVVGKGIFNSNLDYSNKGCKWSFLFSKYHLTVKTIDEQDDCGFGYAVFADGVFKKTSNQVPNYFEDMEGEKIYFRKTKPEEYYKK